MPSSGGRMRTFWSDIFRDRPCIPIVRWVISLQATGINEHDVFFGVGKICHDWFSYVARRFQSLDIHWPCPYPSLPSFDMLEDMIKVSMEPTGKGYGTSGCLHDGCRCMIAGMFDREQFDKSELSCGTW